ncbi:MULTISPECIES: anti-phage protein KwaB [Sphingobacterium]|uniref:anti-phage protein KwaB n=1 Tax=Sphingobacterium TaxID=28453 RepID=UPI002579CF8F|nr:MULTISPECIES: anti-phage protein KwaB [Sphingobacterium]
MNKNELNQNLAFLYEPNANIQVIIYAILKNEGEPRKLDIDDEDLPPIRNMFLESIQSNIISKDDYEILLLSTADERGKCFYEYDLELPNELRQLVQVIGNDNIPNFRFRDVTIEQIDTLIIVLGNDEHQVSLFKKLSPVEVIGRGSYLLKKAAERFERFNDNLLRISPGFQAVSIDETIVILKLSTIERSFGIVEVIQREALLGLEAIRGIEILSNIEALEELVEDIGFARKLTKIARNSPVITRNIPKEQIIAFASNHPALRGRIKFNAESTQINLDTRVSKNLFVKLLNDDYLTSELTHLFYESLAKDGVIVQEDQGN